MNWPWLIPLIISMTIVYTIGYLDPVRLLGALAGFCLAMFLKGRKRFK